MPYISKSDLNELKIVRRMLEMSPDDSSFHDPEAGPGDSIHASRAFTEKVREGTRLWRQTWIFPVMDRIIKKAERSK